MNRVGKFRVARQWLKEITDRMDEVGMTRAELARRLKVTRPRITALLKPESNPELNTLHAVAEATAAELWIGLIPKRGRRK